MPKFEAANAQVLGVSTDPLATNQAFARQIGLGYPLLSDTTRSMTRAFGVLGGGQYAKRAWFVIDKSGVLRYAKVEDPRGLVPNDEILAVVQKYR